MKATQLTQGGKSRLMYVENKNGVIEGHRARIGWVTFSKTGCSVYYRGLTLRKVRGGGVRGNFKNDATEEEFWISGDQATRQQCPLRRKSRGHPH